MQNIRAAQRHGFILAEALVALAILGIVFFALEGSLTMVLRSLAESDREGMAARIAETQRERAFSTTCVASAGSDSINGVVADWTAAPSGQVMHVIQTTRYAQKIGYRIEHYDAIGACQ